MLTYFCHAPAIAHARLRPLTDAVVRTIEHQTSRVQLLGNTTIHICAEENAGEPVSKVRSVRITRAIRALEKAWLEDEVNRDTLRDLLSTIGEKP